MSQPIAVLLDRDGTIIEDRNYLSDPAEVALLPGAVEGLGRLQRLGYLLIVVTNQSGIGRGFFQRSQLDAVHARLAELLHEEKISLAGIYVCPHAPEESCACRKPRTGLVEQAARELSFQPHASFVVGDNACDIDLGRAIGARTILVRTGFGRSQEHNPEVRPDVVVDDLLTAAEWIEQQCGAH